MKQNILLVTWYKSTNCGTCLQAYALYTILSRHFNVDFLGRRTYYSLFDIHLYKKIYSALISKIRVLRKKHLPQSNYQIASKEMLQRYECFCHKYYTFQNLKSYSDYKHICNRYSCFMVGSDQLWNPSMFSPAYMLDFVPANRKKVVYAGSFGVDNITNDKRSLYKKLLLRLDEISVRETRAREIIQDLCGITPKFVLDPTLLLTSDEWNVFSNLSNALVEYKINSKYMIAYFIGSKDIDNLSTVKEVAKRRKLQLVVIPNRVKDYELKDSDVILADKVCPYDFVKLIREAELVCTDSYHAVIFSFLMDTNFYLFPRFKEGDAKSQNGRLDFIVDTFFLRERHVWHDNWMDELDMHIAHSYTKGYAELLVRRKACIDYLINLPNQ